MGKTGRELGKTGREVGKTGSYFIENHALNRKGDGKDRKEVVKELPR